MVTDNDLLVAAEHERISKAELDAATAQLNELVAWIDATVSRLKLIGKTVASAALSAAVGALGPGGTVVEKLVAKQAARLIERAQKELEKP